MLDSLAAGGLFSVFVVALMALGYARVFGAKRPVYIAIAGAVFLTILGSQFLPQGHIFRASIHGSLVFGGWALLWMSPFMAYGVLIWFIRRHVKRDQDGSK